MADVVMRSIEDRSGQRCVDMVRGLGGWAFVECRRDPEDAHGWRRVGVPSGGYGSEQAALDAARAAVPWLAEEGAA
jgi:hypothetical protein